MSGLSKINIEQQLAAIGIQTTPAKMHISLPRLMMKIKTEAAKMEVDKKDPTFKINRKKINSESGLKSSVEFTNDFSNKGKAASLDAVKTIAGDGNFLGDVKRRGNRVVQLARGKSLQRSRKKINLGLMPKNSPEITWDPGYMKINWSRNSIAIDFEGEYLPQVTIDPPYSIEVYLREKPYIRVMVEEGADPYQPGKHVDEIL